MVAPLNANQPETNPLDQMNHIRKGNVAKLAVAHTNE